MSNLATRNGAALSPVPSLSVEEWGVLKNSVCRGFTDTEAQVFAFRCQSMGLSPLSGQITAFKQGGGVVPIVTIDGYRSIAFDCDPGYVVEVEYLIDGHWVDHIPDDTASQVRAKVWRTGSERPVIKAVSRKEFAGSSGPWRTMPNHMLAKVAESHALRIAFPQRLSGSYSSDEMQRPIEQVTVTTTDISPEEAVAAPLPPAASKPKKKAAPALVSTDQLQTLANGMNKVLSDIGREAFLENIKAGFGIESLNQLPAEQFDVVMRTLGDAKRVGNWNEGLDGNGKQVVSDDRIAELMQLMEGQEAATDV